MKMSIKFKHIIIDLSFFMVQRGHIFKSLCYNGKPTGIYYGILKLIQEIRNHYPESVIHICRDGNPIEKRKIYSAYKANRDEISYKPSKDLNLIKNLQKMLVTYPHLYIWYEPLYEADDLIASLALKLGSDCVICTGDNDFLQLMSRGINISKTIKNGKLELRTEDYIQEKYGVDSKHLLVFRALQGDKSDNISGVLPTKQIRKFINNPTDELLNSLNEEEIKNFKRNMKLMSLLQFEKNPIYTKPLQITPDPSLFQIFGLEKLMYRGNSV